MNTLLDIDTLDSACERPTRPAAPRNTDPLKFNAAEKKALEAIGKEIGRNLNNRSLSVFDQLNAFHHSIQAIEAAYAGDWNALASSVKSAIDSTLRIQNVACYIICKQDEAKRNLASDERGSLLQLSTRLSLAATPNTRLDEDRARCIRAAVYASIAADRGLLHILKNNLGAILATVSAEDFPARRQILWTDEITAYANRYRGSRIMVP